VMVPVYDAVFDAPLLGTGWEASSFDAHRALVLGIFGPRSRMTRKQRAMFAEMTGGRAPLDRSPSTLVIIKSRRVAGTRIAVAISSALALRDWPHAPGEQPTVRYYAVDRRQAAIAHGYAAGGFDASALLASEVVDRNQHRLALSNGNVLEIGTSDDGSLRGVSSIAAVFDEAAYIPNLDALLAAARPSLATMPGSMLLIVTTPAGAAGTAYELDKRFFGVNDPDTLVVHARVEQFHPALVPLARRELELDPFRAPAEWQCVWISGLASFVGAPLVDSLTRAEPRVIAPHPTTPTGGHRQFFLGADISAGRSDGTALAVAFVDGSKTVVAGCWHWPAPHDPSKVRDAMRVVVDQYGGGGVLSDYYAAELSRSFYAEGGITLLRAEHNASETYLKLLPLLTSGRVELPPDPTLRTELLGLERVTGPTGKDTVKHRPNGHDDLANAVAHAVVAASRTASAGDARATVIDSEFARGYGRATGDWSLYGGARSRFDWP